MTASNIAPIIGSDPDLDDTFDQLLEAMVDAYRACRALARENSFSEQKRREHALCDIRESLDGHPLEAFQAETLEFISLLITYWRVAENEIGNVPAPDVVH